MKLYARILLAILCAALIVSMPFILSSPAVLQEAAETWYSDPDDDEIGDELDFGRLFFSVAQADEAGEDQVLTEDISLDELLNPQELSIPEEWILPFDFSVPPMPDPDKYTEDGYEDRSIRVRVETQQLMESTVHIAYIEIASASQFRTATVAGIWSSRTDYLQAVASANHAVIAMNGDMFVEQKEGEKKTFEIRMTDVVTQDGKRNHKNKAKDILTIDKNGDFHLFVKSKDLENYISAHKGQTVNAYTFGPALVIDGEIPKLDTHYAYNPHGRTARSAIGQRGPLSYAFVVVEARGNSGKGVDFEQLAEIMLSIGCTQAYNLDGGNTAEMILMGSDPEYPLLHVKGDQQAGYRPQSDIIYFATAVPEEERD